MERTVLTGIDTNVLLRFVLEDDMAQADLVQSWLEGRSAREPGYVSLLVLCEFAWVLARTYRRSRAEIASTITTILNLSVLQVERVDVAQKAMEDFLDSNADFSDCCIAAIATAAGCDHTVTFDRSAARLPSMRLLS